MDVLVARIGKAHGLRGEVTVEVHTDVPEERFAPGRRLAAVPADRGPLTLRSTRVHNGIRLLAFEEAQDRTAAESLRGIRLYAPAEPRAARAPDPGGGAGLAGEADADGWYESELVGLEARAPDGGFVGRVSGLLVRPAQDLLVLDVDGAEVLVPFVEALVPIVDVAGGRIVLDAPPGLLDPSEAL